MAGNFGKGIARHFVANSTAKTTTVQCAPFYIWEIGDGEEEASDSSSMVEGRCEYLEGSGESEALNASSGKETAADAWGSSTEGDVTWREVSISQSEAAVSPVREAEVVLRRA
jgi:hypothetical protein